MLGRPLSSRRVEPLEWEIGGPVGSKTLHRQVRPAELPFDSANKNAIGYYR